MGTREDVGGTTTGGEQIWGRVRDGRAILFDVAGGDGCQENSSGWMDWIGMSDNTFEWKRMQKVWG